GRHQTLEEIDSPTNATQASSFSLADLARATDDLQKLEERSPAGFAAERERGAMLVNTHLAKRYDLIAAAQRASDSGNPDAIRRAEDALDAHDRGFFAQFHGGRLPQSVIAHLLDAESRNGLVGFAEAAGHETTNLPPLTTHRQSGWEPSLR